MKKVAERVIAVLPIKFVVFKIWTFQERPAITHGIALSHEHSNNDSMLEARICLKVGIFLLEINLMGFTSFDLNFHSLDLTAFASIKDVLPIDKQVSAVGWSDLGKALGTSLARALMRIATDVQAGFT